MFHSVLAGYIMRFVRRGARNGVPFLWCLIASTVGTASRAEDSPPAFSELASSFPAKVRPLLATYCLDCHASETREGDLDLQRFATLADVRADSEAWLIVAEKLEFHS